MTNPISFPTQSGRETQGAISLPQTERSPAVVLLQEYWGLNDHVRHLAERLADEGFVVLAPDLYDGKSTKDGAEAAKMMQALDPAATLDKIAGAVQHLATHARTTGKVGVTGFCMGGAYAFTAAAIVPGVAAAVPFYGFPDRTKVDLGAITCPVQAHFAKTDPWAKPALAETLRDELVAKGRKMELYVYDAQHAFMNDTRPEVYSPDDAKLAWGRMVAFFKANLA